MPLIISLICLERKNEIKVNAEAAVTVQMICSLYLQGCGQKEIARRLNDMGRKTPAQLRAEKCAGELKKVAQMQKMWALRRPVLDAHIVSLQNEIQRLEQEIDGIVMEKFRSASW